MTGPGDNQAEWRPRARRRGLFSPLTRRILAVNLVALGILAGGLLYLDEYRDSLIDAELKALSVQARMFAAALGEGAVATDDSLGQKLASDIADQIVRRLVETTGTRAQLYVGDGRMVADSRRLMGPGGLVKIEELPPPGDDAGWAQNVLDAYDRLMHHVTGRPTMEAYREGVEDSARDFPEVARALLGEENRVVRALGGDRLLLSVAVPVQRYKQVLGGLMLSRDSRDIDAALLEVRLDILKIFAVALGITVLLSVYLAGTIGRPIHRLAVAAERVRRDRGRKQTLPDFRGRDDEIGDLAESLSEMTTALWQRMDAIENFAADVAHEIKNPLTSLRSAVETTARLKDPGQQRKLMAIIQEDVGRLDRLISDISDASRLDAELSRAETETVDLNAMLSTLTDIHATTAKDGLQFRYAGVGREALTVDGIEGRLAQVFRNLLVNAASFSPPGGTIAINAGRDGDWAVITVDDDGPGLPKGKEDAIFARFYTERRDSEKFGTHSGLGLSISRQIVDAHGGRITADNRTDGSGRVLGARFTVRLPVVEAPSEAPKIRGRGR